MPPVPNLAYRIKITKFYRLALICYTGPLILFPIGLVSELTHGLGIISVFPLSLIGITYTVLGFKISVKHHDIEKKDIGYANLLLGLVMTLVGALIFAFLFIKLQ